VSDSINFSLPADKDTFPGWAIRELELRKKLKNIEEEHLLFELDAFCAPDSQSYKFMLKFAEKKIRGIFEKLSLGEAALFIEHGFLVEAAVKSFGFKTQDMRWVIFVQEGGGKVIVIPTPQ
jgi:hypothetical protein